MLSVVCPRGIWRRPRGGFGHAGLDSDLPGSQKPPGASKAREASLIHKEARAKPNPAPAP